MLNVGIAGIGFMGMIHYLAYQKVPGVKVTAISSRDPKKRAHLSISITVPQGVGKNNPALKKLEFEAVTQFQLIGRLSRGGKTLEDYIEDQAKNYAEKRFEGRDN